MGTRTPDLYRVNFEVTTLEPFPHLAFPHLLSPENPPKHTSFDGELMASFSVQSQKTSRASPQAFRREARMRDSKEYIL